MKTNLTEELPKFATESRNKLDREPMAAEFKQPDGQRPSDYPENKLSS